MKNICFLIDLSGPERPRRAPRWVEAPSPAGGARGAAVSRVTHAVSAAAHKDARRLQRQRSRLGAALRGIPGIGWARAPASRIGRLVVGGALIVGGLFGFLPVL